MGWNVGKLRVLGIPDSLRIGKEGADVEAEVEVEMDFGFLRRVSRVVWGFS